MAYRLGVPARPHPLGLLRLRATSIGPTCERLPNLAFDHDDIASLALATLRTELESKHISFELLPEKFTLRQLQSLHEVVLDKKLDKRNFRKNIKKLDHVVPLNEKKKVVLAQARPTVHLRLVTHPTMKTFFQLAPGACLTLMVGST